MRRSRSYLWMETQRCLSFKSENPQDLARDNPSPTPLQATHVFNGMKRIILSNPTVNLSKMSGGLGLSHRGGILAYTRILCNSDS